MLSGAVPDSSGRPLAGRGPFGRSKHVGHPPGEVERVLRHGIMNAVGLGEALGCREILDRLHDDLPGGILLHGWDRRNPGVLGLPIPTPSTCS